MTMMMSRNNSIIRVIQMIYNFYGTRKANSSWFASCCGARYSKVTDKTKFQQGHKGILVFDGAVGKEYKGTKQSLTHVKTKNGTITVGIRHTW